jgi:hypothetical protein
MNVDLHTHFYPEALQILDTALEVTGDSNGGKGVKDRGARILTTTPGMSETGMG